ncbi:MAG: aldo/keto reductase [Bacteriovoracaceae bacterium]|nr:aldo/keto reductase [Bacteriovoracaceae bacterium]
MSRANKLVLGTVQLGLKYGIANKSGRPNHEESREILKFAMDSGIDTLDTAQAYGDVHEIISSFHQNSPKKFKIQTKFNSLPYNIVDYLKSQAELLKVPSIETLYFHSFEDFENCLDFESFKKAKELGLLNEIGVSIYNTKQLEKCISNKYIDTIQSPFNLFDNWSERGALFEKAHSNGKKIYTRSVFLQGLFFLKKEELKGVLKKMEDCIEKVQQLSKEKQLSIQDLALNYCLSFEQVSGVLVGVDTKGQLEQNLKAMDVSLEKQTIEQINGLKVNYPELLNPVNWE